VDFESVPGRATDAEPCRYIDQVEAFACLPRCLVAGAGEGFATKEAPVRPCSIAANFRLPNFLAFDTFAALQHFLCRR
jgi:hypothetical protein